MPLKQYVPISLGVFALVILTARYYSVPVAPFALVLFVGETIIGLQLEDQKIFRFLEELARSLKSNLTPHS
ncbi:MAG TPA: hypothetical protein VLN48_18900 [Bryobacteraceae bacterium]|nr:hypothetical protein [Bryobacteraceae bacterium]